MITLIDKEKALEKIQHLFMTKTLRKLGIQENFFYWYRPLKKEHKSNPAGNILNGEKQKISP